MAQKKTRLELAESLDQIAPDQWAALAGILGKVANVDPLDIVKATLRGTVVFTLTIKSRLTASTAVILPAITNPTRLKDREGVWMSSEAAKLFGQFGRLAEKPERIIERRDLTEPLSDFKIIEEWGGKDVAAFAEVGQLDLVISQLVTKQADGKPGDLLNDGEANTFYVRDPGSHERVLYVNVEWSRDCREWHVFSGEADANQWIAGNRVFSANAV